MGIGVWVGGTIVAVGGIGVWVGGTAVAVGGIGVDVGIGVDLLLSKVSPSFCTVGSPAQEYRINRDETSSE